MEQLKETEVAEAYGLLKQHGVLDEPKQAQPASPDLSALRALLRQELLYLLERDFERLLQCLYRIDVPEDKFKQALLTQDPAGQITELILQRELQKVKTRRWYAQRTTSPLKD